MRLLPIPAFLAASLVIGMASAEDAAVVQKKLTDQFALTKTTADHSDIVTAGDVVVLHKDGLMMCSTAASYPFSNTYQNGLITSNLNNRAKDAAKSFLKGKLPFGGGGSASDAVNNGCPSRKFVAGEKFWITEIEVAKDNTGIIISTFSDPYKDVRYYGQLKFPYPKNSPPSADDMLKTVGEVITVQPGDNDKAGDSKAGDSKGGDSAPKQKGGGQQQSSAPSPALAPIAPPPPPSDQPPAPPKTIAKGQSKDDVVAAWGQPTKVVKLSAKEIYFYPDMKVTFVAGKVSDVE